MPLWLLAVAVLGALLLGAAAEHARAALDAHALNYGRHSLSRGTAPAAEPEHQSPPPSVWRPEWDDTDRIMPVQAPPTAELVLRVLAGLRQM